MINEQRNMASTENSRRPWSSCPDCEADLIEGIKTRPPYDKCPFCGAPIQPIWWQRVVWAVVALFLGFAFPAWLGLIGWDVFFAGLFCFFPATVVAYIVVFKTMPPRYVRQKETYITLFSQHH